MTPEEAKELAGKFTLAFRLFPDQAGELEVNLMESKRAQRYGGPFMFEGLANLIETWAEKEPPRLAVWLDRARDSWREHGLDEVYNAHQDLAKQAGRPLTEEQGRNVEEFGKLWRSVLSGSDVPPNPEVEQKRADYRALAAGEKREVPDVRPQAD